MPALAAELTLIASRNAHVTSLYLRLPYEDAQDIFAVSPLRDSVVTDATFGEAQDRVTDELTQVAEALSLVVGRTQIALVAGDGLVHAKDEPLPFQTPLDGSIAAAVCASPDKPLLELASLTLYATLRADTPRWPRRMELTFPRAEAPLTVTVLSYHRGALVRELQQSLEPGDALVLHP